MSVMEVDSLRSHDAENPHFCVYRLTHLHLPSMKPEDSLYQKGRVVEWTSRGLGESEGLTPPSVSSEGGQAPGGADPPHAGGGHSQAAARTVGGRDSLSTKEKLKARGVLSSEIVFK